MPTNVITQNIVESFDDALPGFDDMLVIGKEATVYQPEDGEAMYRAGDQFWVPNPMIGSTFSGFDQTANFGSLTETAILVNVGYHRSDPRSFSAKELRSKSTIQNWMKAAVKKLASDVNYFLTLRLAMEASLVVRRTVSPTGYDDIGLAHTALIEIGAGADDASMFLAPRIANAMIGDLAKRPTDAKRDLDAYGKALLSDIGGFNTFSTDQAIPLAAAAGGVTTVNGANQYYVPKAQIVDNLGQPVNVDNRYSVLNVTAANAAGIKAGDAFTIAGVNSVHMISKLDTTQLQTFRVIAVNGSALTITPALISGGGGSRAETEYKNTTATPANGAAITWLNTTTAQMNPFFKKGALWLIPGSYSVEPEDGWDVALRYQTALGLNLSLVKQGNINDLTTKMRIDLDFGTALPLPQYAGIEIFNQL